MKRTAVWLAAVFVAGVVIITVARLHSAGDSEDNSQINTEERSRISRFWTIYDRASALRTRGEFLRAADLYRQALNSIPATKTRFITWEVVCTRWGSTRKRNNNSAA